LLCHGWQDIHVLGTPVVLLGLGVGDCPAKPQS
jgi:hypothetical protein